MRNALLTVSVVLAALPTAAVGQQVEMATFAGGPKTDMLTGAAVLSDGSIVAGGVVDATQGGEKGDQLQGGQGTLVRLTKDGKPVAKQSLPGGISDLDADAEGNVYVTGPQGSAKFDAALGRALWTSNAGGAAARICVGLKGGALVLAAKQLTAIDANGRTAGSLPLSGGYVEDVACDPTSGLIFVCGFDNKHGTPPGQKNYPVQVAFVRALDGAGKQVWQAYGWGGQEVADRQLMADTRAYRLALGRDGKLYVAGESAGGNTMWSRSSRDLNQPGNLVKGDKFQNAYNTAANHITAVVRLDSKTGQSEIGTMLLARLSSGKGNTIRPRALAADEAGNVYVGGVSTFSPPKSEGSFGLEGGGAFFVAFDGQFNRIYATTLAGGGTTRAVACGPGAVVAVGDTKTEFVTFKPLKPEGDTNGDGFLVIFSAAK